MSIRYVSENRKRAVGHPINGGVELQIAPRRGGIDELDALAAETGRPENCSEFVVSAMSASEAMVRRCARRWLRSPDLVEDVVQFTFGQLCESVSQGRPPKSVRNWLRAVASNRAARVRRSQAVDFSDSTGSTLRSAASTGGDPVAAFARSELRSHLDRAMAGLPKCSREVIALRMAGWKLTEVAHALSITEQTVKWRLRKSLDRMRNTLHFYDSGTL